MRKPTLRVYQTVAAFLLLVILTSTVAAADGYGRVELIRDRWGVPHAMADTDAGAMFGLGYATALDRGFQMHYSLRIIQGRLAEVIGPVKKIQRDETAVYNDRKMRTFGFYRQAKRLAAELDSDSAEMLDAYSAGVNHYFKQNADTLNEMFDQVGLVPEPWTPADCLASWWHLGQFFATDGTRDLMHYRNITEGRPTGRQIIADLATERTRQGPAPEQLPSDESTAVVQESDVDRLWLRRARAFMQEHGFTPEDAKPSGSGQTAPKFSHAWVVDGHTSGTGSAVLVSKPQTPVTNPSLFYEFHVKGKSFDARGIGVPGSPALLIGWNRNVAWGVTALGADQADLFRLKTDDEHPGRYQFDGVWHEMETISEEIRVAGGRTQTIVIRQTHLGPIVNEFAFSRPGDAQVALKRIPLRDSGVETIQGALAMMRSKSAGEFLKAVAGWRFPSANVVFGDSQGNIGYSTIGALPLRPAHALDGGGAAHDGSAQEHDWLTIVPAALVPQVLNPEQGYLFSGNHRPAGSFYPIPLGIRTGSGGDTLRSWRLRELLADGRPLSTDRVRRMKDDSVNPARREIVRIGYHLRDALNRNLSEEATLALGHLEDWHAAGARCDLEIPGTELALELNTFFRMMATDLALIYGGGESGLSYFLKTVGRRIDDNPAAAISDLEQEFVDRALADAWHNAGQKFGRDPSAWSQNARRTAAERKLGFYESLDGFPSLYPQRDLTVGELSCVDVGTISSQSGEAYTQWVPLDDVDRALSLLPPGAGERPGDPMRTANLESWRTRQLHPAPLSAAAVERIAKSKIVLSR